MSGGALDYVYIRVEDAGTEILRSSKDPLHVAFAKHLMKVAKALHDVEWVLSGDSSEGDEVNAIRSVLIPEDVLESTLEEINKSLSNLRKELNKVDEHVKCAKE